MSDRRKDDPPGGRKYFRTDRLHEDGGKWYFTTREGTLEGPFDDRLTALDALERYIASAQLDLINPELAVLDEPLHRLH